MKPANMIMAVIIGMTNALAQQVVTATGGIATGSGGTASYSIGQVSYVTTVGTGGSSQQGVQQAYDFVIVSAAEMEDTVVFISVFPNPVMDHILLNVIANKLQNPNFQLYDMNGKHIQNQMINHSEIRIPMENVSSGMYFLIVRDGENELKKFKIIKHR